MTSTLRLTDGTTTITLSSGDMYITRYRMLVAVDRTAPLKETCRIRLNKTNTTNRANIQAINRLFQQADNYQKTESGPRVYVESDPGDTGTFYRSMLYANCRTSPQDRLLGEDLRNANIEVELEWNRQPFWEGPLAQIPLTNTSATDNTSGITVSNAHDATYEDFVTIASDDVLGDLPSPIKLQMVNSKNGADASDEIFVYHNVESTPASFEHILEGEAATGATVTDVGDATSSGAYYAQLDWTITTETLIAEWALSSALLSYAKGGKFAVLARWAALFPYSDCWLRLKLLTDTNYNVLWTGELKKVSEIESGRELSELDTLYLPPYLQGLATIKGIVLRLYGLRNNATNQIKLDALMLGAISHGNGYLHFKSVDRGIPYNETFIHDDTENQTYHRDGSNNDIAEFTPYGGEILLEPNADQRLYFRTSDYNGYAKVDQTWTVKLWYRPRRSSL